MKKHYLTGLFLFFILISFGQTKQELTESIISYQRAFSDTWIETKLDENNLVIYEQAFTYATNGKIQEVTLNMEKVESVAIKMINEYYGVYIYFKGKEYHRKYFNNYNDYQNKKYSNDLGVFIDWINIVSFKDKKLATDLQSDLVKLAKLCGSKNVKTF
jgi:hypothetical protein